MEDKEPIDQIGLPSVIVRVLKQKGVKDYGTLCCVTLEELQAWGLDRDQIGQIIALVKDG